jgi:tetratricopeptide (TPR) repeat protein
MMDASIRADAIEYIFIHDKLKELVYEGIPEEERSQLHLQLAEGLEAFYARDPDSHVAEVAHHFLRSPERKKSVQYGLQAGLRLSEMHAYREAASIYEAVLSRLEGSDFAIRVRVLGRLADIALLTGKYDEGIRVLEEMLRTGEKLLNWKSRGVARAKIGGLHIRKGDPDAALKVLESALAEVEPQGDTVEKAHILSTMGLAHLRRREPEPCLERCAQAAEAARGTGKPQALAAMHNTAGMALYGLGRYEEALKEYEAGLEICKAAGNLQGEAASHSNIGTVLSEMGREAQAEKALRMAIEIFERVGDLRARGQAINNLVELHLRQGKLIPARDQIRVALQIGEEISDPEILGRSRAVEGQVLTALGQYDDAEAVLTLALRTAEESSAERETCQALIGLARLRAVWDPQEEPQPEIRRAVEIARERKWPYLVGMALLQARDLKLCGQADRIFRSLKAEREIAICALQRAHNYTGKGDSMGAHHLIEEAEKRIGSAPSPALALALLRERGRWLALEGMGEDELRQALAIAHQTQARPVALEIAADLARILQQKGDPEGALKVASDASRLFREMMEHVPARKRPAYLRMPSVRVIREFLDSQPSS